MKVFTYCFSMAIEIFLPCYFGNELTVASDQLSMSLFHSNWIKGEKDYSDGLKIFMAVTKKPIIIKAMRGLVNANYETFTRICNSAYSLYALLKKINNKSFD